MSEFKVGDRVITRWDEKAFRCFSLPYEAVPDGEHTIDLIEGDVCKLNGYSLWWYPLSNITKVDDAPEVKDDGGPAFPGHVFSHYENHVPVYEQIPGMSLRDYFAAKAMQSILSIGDANANMFLSKPRGRELTQWLAEDAYAYADAMIEARKK